MMTVGADRLFSSALDLKPARGGVGFGHSGPDLRGGQPAFGETERVPTQSEAMAQRQRRHDPEGDGQTPTPRSQGAKHVQRPHGKTLRSSSKCGPSRREVQSPPQIIAVLCRAAAALKAAAIRGYSGQSQRT